MESCISLASSRRSLYLVTQPRKVITYFLYSHDVRPIESRAVFHHDSNLKELVTVQGV